MQAFLPTTDDRWLPVLHPSFLFSYTVIPQCKQLFSPICSLFFSSLSLYSVQCVCVCVCPLILFACTLAPPSSHPTMPTISQCQGCPGCLQGERETRDWQGGAQREREMEGRGGGVRSHGNCVFVSARESDKQWVTVRRKHTHTHSHIHTLPLTQREAK